MEGDRQDHVYLEGADLIGGEGEYVIPMNMN